MSLAIAHQPDPLVGDVIGDYTMYVDELAILVGGKQDRVRRARQFTRDHPDLNVWMQRPTTARLTDLHRRKAWPFMTWLFVSARVHPDLDLLLSKPPGCGLTNEWSLANAIDVSRVEDTAVRMGWSLNWSRQVIFGAASLICVWVDKTLDQLDDTDFDAIVAELDNCESVTASARFRLRTRIFSLHHLCFQLGICQMAPRMGQTPALSAAQKATLIRQPQIASQVVRYAETIATVVKPGTAQGRIKSIRVLCDWLADEHPQITRLDQLDRRLHLEPFLAWDQHRPCRGNNGKGRNISVTQFHADVVDLRVFFEDMAIWGWAEAPQRRLLFVADIPRLPEPLPRALPPNIDRDLMAAVHDLDDVFARTGILLLRATGMRIGELLDLELDCVVDFGAHGTWIKVPIGKLGTERMVPLDPEPLAVFDAWITQRGQQRSLDHPGDGRACEFVFLERGRRPSAHRIRQGLRRATRLAGLAGPAGEPLRVVPHQLRHTFGTELVNAGMSLPALMSLLGHVTPEMTLRYAQVASPTVKAAYDKAMNTVNSKRYLLPNRTAPDVVLDRVNWLHAEMIKTKLAHGFCSRDPAAGSCPYANICEQCDSFVPDPNQEEVIIDQLQQIRSLREDAKSRGWTSETERHKRVAERLEQHQETIQKSQQPLTPPPKAG